MNEEGKKREVPPFTQIALRHRAAEFYKRTAVPLEDCQDIDDLEPHLARFDLLCAAEEYDRAAELLVGEFHRKLDAWGYYHLLVDLYGKLRGKIRDPNYRQKCLGNLGNAYCDTGRAVEGVTCYEQALELAREQGERADQVAWLGGLGICCQNSGQHRLALKYYEEARAVLSRIAGGPDKRKRQMILLINLGNLCGDLGETDRARDYLHRALDVAREVRDLDVRREEALALENLAYLLVDEAKYDEAIQRAREGIEIAQKTHHAMSLAFGYRNISLANLYSGSLADARAAAELGRQYRVPEFQHLCHAILGVVALRQRDRAAAETAFREAVDQADRFLQASPRYYLALDSKGLALSGLALASDSEDLEPAIQAHRQARSVAADRGIVRRVARLYDELAPTDPDGRLAEVRGVATGQ